MNHKRTDYLTHWGRVTHICVGKLISIGSDNGLSPGRRQAIIWTNAGILLIGTLATNFSEILIEIHSFSFKKMHLKMSSAKGCLFSLGLNELTIVKKHNIPVCIFYGMKCMGGTGRRMPPTNRRVFCLSINISPILTSDATRYCESLSRATTTIKAISGHLYVGTAIECVIGIRIHMTLKPKW